MELGQIGDLRMVNATSMSLGRTRPSPSKCDSTVRRFPEVSKWLGTMAHVRSVTERLNEGAAMLVAITLARGWIAVVRLEAVGRDTTAAEYVRNDDKRQQGSSGKPRGASASVAREGGCECGSDALD